MHDVHNFNENPIPLLFAEGRRNPPGNQPPSLQYMWRPRYPQQLPLGLADCSTRLAMTSTLPTLSLASSAGPDRLQQVRHDLNLDYLTHLPAIHREEERVASPGGLDRSLVTPLGSFELRR